MRGPRGTARQGNRSYAAMRLSVNTEGFAPWSGLVEVRSEVPVRVLVSLGLAPVATEVQVSDSATWEQTLPNTVQDRDARHRKC